MIRIALAAAAAFFLASAAPAYACGADCPMHKAKAAGDKTAAADCPMHGAKVAANEKAEKKGHDKDCACKDAKDCKCPHAEHAANCDCPACHAKKGEKKDETKKT